MKNKQSRNILVPIFMFITKLLSIVFQKGQWNDVIYSDIVPSGKRWVIEIEFLLAYADADADSGVLNIECFHV